MSFKSKIYLLQNDRIVTSKIVSVLGYLTLYCKIIFTNYPTNIESYLVFHFLSVVAAFNVHYILVEALFSHVCVQSLVLLEFRMIRQKDMDNEEYHAANVDVVLHQGSNQDHFVFGLVILREALKKCNKLLHATCSVLLNILCNYLTSGIFIFGPTNKNKIDFCHILLREEVLKVCDGCRHLF